MDKDTASQIETMVLRDLQLGRAIRGKLPYTGDTFDYVYEFTFVDHSAGQCGMTMTHFCTSELRLHLSGCEVVAGWPYAQVPGATFSQKQTVLNQYALDRVLELAAKVGFVRTMAAAGDILLIPSGYLVCSVTMDEGSAFLRWALSSCEPAAQKRECELTHTALAALSEAYPSVCTKAHKAWLAHLELHMG